MRTSQIGDRIQAHYTKKFTDGSIRSSRLRGDQPLELVVGINDPRLPGVASGLVGLVEGQKVKIHVPAKEENDKSKSARIHEVDRARFSDEKKLAVGKRVLMRVSKGRSRRVLVLEIRERKVVVDINNLRDGQPLELEVELIAILTPVPEGGHSDS